MDRLWGPRYDPSCAESGPGQLLENFGDSGLSEWHYGRAFEESGQVSPLTASERPISQLLAGLKEQIHQLQSELIVQRLRVLESQAGSRTNLAPEFLLLKAGVLQKFTELREITKSIFSCEPKVTAQTDPEITDDHYLLFHVTINGDVESAGKLQDAWHEATAVILGKAADKVRLMLSIK